MKFINFAFVKFSVFLVLGILAAHFFPISTLSLNFLFALLVGVFGFWLWARKQLIQTVYFGIITYICFFTIGFFSYQIRLPQFQEKHYSHFITDETSELLQLKITQTLKADKFNFKYFANVNAKNGIPTNGKILLSISKDSLSKSFTADEILLVYASISEIPKPLNPYQFDYSAYIKSLGVYDQLRISEKEILETSLGNPTLKGTAQNLRAAIVEKLKNQN